MAVFDFRNPHFDEPPQLFRHFQAMLCAHRFEASVLRGLQVNGQPFERQWRRRTGGEVRSFAHPAMVMRFVV